MLKIQTYISTLANNIDYNSPDIQYLQNSLNYILSMWGLPGYIQCSKGVVSGIINMILLNPDLTINKYLGSISLNTNIRLDIQLSIILNSFLI